MLVMLVFWLVTPGKGGLSNRIHAALSLFTLVLAAAWLLSPYADKPGVTDVVENYFKVAVFYVLVVTTVRDERGLRLLVMLYLAAVGLYMAHSMLEFVNGRYMWRMGIRRMIGVDITYSDPNAFATTLLYALPMALPFWFERPRRLPRFLLLGFALAACGCILLTGSRAGFVGLAALGGMVLWVSSRRKAPVVFGGALAACFAFAVLSVALPDELQDRYLTLYDSSRGPENAQVSAQGRLDGFLYGIQAWQSNPIFGHGPSSFAYVTGREGQAHNLYGQVMCEMGTLGALALLAVVACFAWNWLETRRLYRRGPGDDDSPPTDYSYLVCRSVMMNVLLLLLMGWAGHNLFRYNWQWFAAFQAIALHCIRLRAAARERAADYALPYLILPRLSPAGPAGRRAEPYYPDW